LFDKRDATRIAQKLGATPGPGRKHDKVRIRWKGVIIAAYNIRRDRTASHDFIPEQIHVSLREARDLARCPMSAKQDFDLMGKKKLLPAAQGS
jgi:hypothetical protein